MEQLKGELEEQMQEAARRRQGEADQKRRELDEMIRNVSAF